MFFILYFTEMKFFSDQQTFSFLTKYLEIEFVNIGPNNQKMNVIQVLNSGFSPFSLMISAYHH